MKKIILFIFFSWISFFAMAARGVTIAAPDTAAVIKLNKQAFDLKLTNPQQTLAIAGNALAMARKLGYSGGIAEAYREKGIGYYYLGQPIKAIDSYVTALNYFKQINDLRGQGKVYNNIGNLYRNDNFDAAAEFFNKALVIAKKLADNRLIAGIYNNLGTVYYHKNSLYLALNYYDKSGELFDQLKDSANVVQCTRNKGVVYFNLRQFDKAQRLLLTAHEDAKHLDLKETVASIDITLAEIYITRDKYKQAESSIAEGLALSDIIKSVSMPEDLKYTRYQLEIKRKNYKSAVFSLYDIYHKDSVSFVHLGSTQISLFREQANELAKQKENEILVQRQQYDRTRFWGMAVVASLLLFLVGLLISNVKRKAKTNQKLTGLNAEISRQKEDLDRINHHLEEIIDGRTKELQVKNNKLADYSSYLSHQIRGPIATLKGVLILEKEKLVNQGECIELMNKSVNAIDDKILDMADILQNQRRQGFQ